MLFRKFGPITSIFLLLGLVLITTGVWYMAYRAGVIGNTWASSATLNDY